MNPNFDPKNPIKKSKWWRGEPRKCKYCDKLAKKNLRPDGKNKGYYRTCGSTECLDAHNHDNAVNARKAWKGTRFCEVCKNEYLARGRKQRWCKTCVPNAAARGRMRRYGISEPQYQKMLKEQDYLCYICKDKYPRCVDHDHVTNKVRKLLCDGCNHQLVGIDNELWLEAALAYIRESKKG
jgi:hypothetical protein